MMTSVRMVSPIIETPSRMPEAKATTAVTAMTVGRIAPLVAPQQEERDAFEQPRLGDDRHEEGQAEDEQHRVGVNQIVEAGERQQVLAAPRATSPRSAISTCHADVGRPQNVATMTSSMP